MKIMRCVLESGEQKLFFLSRLLCPVPAYKVQLHVQNDSGKGDEKAASHTETERFSSFYPKTAADDLERRVDRGPDKHEATITEAAIMRECRTIRLAYINSFPQQNKGRQWR